MAESELLWDCCGPIALLRTDLSAGRMPEKTVPSPQSCSRSTANAAPVMSGARTLMRSCEGARCSLTIDW